MKHPLTIFLLGIILGCALTLGVIRLVPRSAETQSPASARSVQPVEQYYASKVSMKYHRPDCEWARKIPPANLVIFASKQEAEAQGYKPCKVCKP